MPFDVRLLANELVGRDFGGNKEIKCSGVRVSKAGENVRISSQGLAATVVEEDGTVKQTNVGAGVLKTVDLNVEGNLTCQDLTVFGDNTTIQSEKIVATDPIIQIGYNTTTTTALRTEFGGHDRGLDMLFSKNNGTTSRAFLGLDVSDPPKFVIKIEDNINDVDTHPNTFSGSFANFKANNIEATGTLGVTGATTLSDNLTVAPNKTSQLGGNVTIKGNMDTISGVALELGTTNANAVNISKTGDMTTVLGTLNVTGATNLNDTTQSDDKDTGALIVDGGVGIERNLNVGSAINAQEITIGSNGNDKNRLRIDYNSNKNTYIDYGTIQTDGTGGNLYIRSATTTNNTTRLTILGNGNVGIGNFHNPSVLLDVFDKNYDDNDQYRELAKFSMTNDSNDNTYQRLFIGQWNRQKNMFIQVKKQENSQDIVGSLILQPIGGRVGIGAVPADTKLHVSVGMNFDGTIPIAKFHARNNNTYDSYLTIEERRHTQTSPTNVDDYSTRIQKRTGNSYTGFIEFNPVNGPGGIAFGTSDADERLRITSSGNVGIGTTDPRTDLHLHNSTQVSSGYLGSGMILSRYWATNADTKASGIWHEYNTTEKLCFKVTGNSGNIGHPVGANNGSMVLTDTGRLGIGTTQPEIDFHLYGSPLIQHSYVHPTSGDGAGWYKIGYWEGNQGSRLKISLLGQSGYNTVLHHRGGETIIYASMNNNDDTSSANVSGQIHAYGAHIIESAKFYQISSNRYKYEIYVKFRGHTKTSIKYECNNTTEFTPEIPFSSITTPSATDGQTLETAIFTHVINNEGHAGFGTTDPYYPFHVGNDLGLVVDYTAHQTNSRIYKGYNYIHTNGVYFACLAYFRGDVCVDGNVASVAFNNASDERIKENIVDANASEILDLFRNIELKKYNYIDKLTRGTATTFGFIAQQIQQIMPSNVKIATQTIPNIYKTGTVSGVGNNIITFTDFNTANLLTGDNVTGIIEIDQYPVDNDEIKTKIKTVIDQNTIEVEHDLSKYMGDIDDEGNGIEGTKVFVFGQEINDLLLLDKMKIFTIATAALQEVDRQLQAEKVKTATLETTSSTLTSELNAEKAKVATLETTCSTLTSELNAEKAKVATLESENIGLRADIEAIKAHLGLST